MSHTIISEISGAAQRILICEYGYCAVMKSEDMICLNADSDDESVSIEIKIVRTTQADTQTADLFEGGEAA